MTSLSLQNALKKRVKIATQNLLLKSPSSNDKVIQVFEQHLPNKVKSTSRNPEDTFYPCVIVMMDEGTVENFSVIEEVKFYFVIGVYDEEDDNQGYRDAMIIKERIIQDFERNPSIENQYEFIQKYKWKYDDESSAPYHYVWIEAYFEVTRMTREDVEDML